MTDEPLSFLIVGVYMAEFTLGLVLGALLLIAALLMSYCFFREMFPCQKHKVKELDAYAP